MLSPADTWDIVSDCPLWEKESWKGKKAKEETAGNEEKEGEEEEEGRRRKEEKGEEQLT